MAGVPANGDASLPMVDPEELRELLDDLPDYRSYVLTAHNGGMQMTVMPEAWRGSEREPDNPGSVKQYYFEEEDLLVVDLSKP